MAGPTTQVLADDLNKLSGDLKALAAESSAFRLDFSGFRAQVETQLALIKWVGVFFSGILVALFTGSVTIAWNASAMNSELKQHGRQIQELNGEVKQQGTQIKELSGEVKQQGTQIKELSGEVKLLCTRIDESEKNNGKNFETVIQQLKQIHDRLNPVPKSEPKPGG